MAVGPFLDTSVMLAGLIDFGPQSAPAQSVLHAVAEKIAKDPATAWHCCLEFFSVSTRLPAEYPTHTGRRAAPARSRDFRAGRSARPARRRPAADAAFSLSRPDNRRSHLRRAHCRGRASGRCACRGHRQSTALPRRPAAWHPRRDPNRVPRVVEKNVTPRSNPRSGARRSSAARFDAAVSRGAAPASDRAARPTVPATFPTATRPPASTGLPRWP